MIYGKKADFDKLAQKHNISPITARIMINRAVLEEEFDSYLSVNTQNMYSPWLFKDMEKAVSLLSEKIEAGKKIRVIGDYDIDGICSTYILVKGLRAIGAIVDMDIPHRVKDGYGINEDIIYRASSDDIDTIITCDNGIAAIEEVKLAKKLGMSVIVTDHHELPLDEAGAVYVEADCIVNPKQPDCNYPYKMLCGGAIAYKFIQACISKIEPKLDLNMEELLELAGIATIGDVVDLNNENRIIAANAIKLIKNTKNIGLKALMEVTGIEPEKISSYHIGFVIGPCLNAGGRLETAKEAYELFDTKSYEEALVKAERLKQLNDTRKSLTVDGEELALREALKYGDDKVIVLYLKGVHESIAGIIAGRVRESLYKPVIILTDSEDEMIAKGSGRSIDSYNLHKELTACKELIEKFGGHQMAAGLSLKKDNIDKLRKKLNESNLLCEDDMVQKVWIDVPMPFSYITERLIDEFKHLEPFGKANEKPVFAEKNIQILGMNILGKNNNVLKMNIKNSENYFITAMFFGDIDTFISKIKEKYGEDELEKAKIGLENNIRLSITYYPQINSYMGRNTIQVIINKYMI